ncbi:MAG: hypothetical protein A2583_12095 [Bdellovibrionales bacterium RIFOXYD1_FULL_53_11]|nr:MAG: hypothetical protein A2583_12095 [Bdellovibrionales bacterium RIFOXYD1_FULL_53_11]
MGRRSWVTCKEDKTVTIGWQNGGIFKKKGLDSEASNPPQKPSSMQFIISGKKGVLKGNSGNANLIKLSQNVFLEETLLGNIVFWTIITGYDDIPTYIFQQKAYNLAGPYSITVAYKCD